MKQITYTKEQLDLLSSLFASGVPFEYCLTTRERKDFDDYAAHQATALLTLQKVQKDLDLYFEDLLQTERYKGRSRDEFFQISIEPEKLTGKQISLKTFLGSYYSFDQRRAAIRGRTSKFLNSYFWAGENETQENALKLSKEFGRINRAYAYAFFEPPYTMRGEATQKEDLFHNTEKLMFGRFDENAIIWSWSDDCSNYFDAGKEWWGTFFYTYSLPGSDTILGMVASQTD
ncbi:MAG: hypothetical protein AAGD96_23550 [Chloroflexota bacterium]